MTAKQKTRAELQAEIDALNAEIEANEEAAVESTRKRSPRKPRDRKPKLGSMIEFEYEGETYEVDSRHSRDARTGAMFAKNNFEGAITRMIGAEGYEDLLDSLEDEDGFVDAETLGGWVDAFFEAAGAKN